MRWATIYITLVLLANYTATWFIPFRPFGLVAVGTVVFGATFTARDYVHKEGRPRVYLMICVAALSSSVLVWLGTAYWRVVLASVLAIVLSETVDTEIYQRLIMRPWLVRVVGSNLVSIPIDSIAFNLLAFAGVFATPVIISIVLGEIVVKFLVGGAVALWRE